MKLSGHKTEAVYRRCAIVSDADLRAAAGSARGASRIDDGHNDGHSDAAAGLRSEEGTQLLDLVAEGEGFEPPRASRPGGFQVHCLAS